MKKFELLAASALALSAAPAWAQTAPSGTGQTAVTAAGQAQQGTATEPSGATSDAQTQGTGFADDIVVTAQRQSERLQDVPISVSAFTGAALETQQIKNSLDLQTSLPNVTFTKTNFTSASFTIRGIGDLCTGFSCDAATGIHINDVPVPATRLFETEFLDLERIEVLRGPQGTLFGRNATSGVVNLITARPDLTGIHASGSAEYGNYDSKKVQGMFNLPLTDTIGIRVAGQYLNRDGYTYNQFDNQRIDGRELYQVRGSLRFQPTSSTTIDLLGSYFHEDDNRSRIQKQLCHRDPTAVLGCLPDRLANETVNANSTFADLLSSTEFFRILGGQLTAANPAAAPVAAALASYGLRSINNYNADGFSQFVQPDGLRTVDSNIDPTYFSDEINAQGRIDQDFDKVSVSLIGGYNRSRVDSTSGYFLNVPNTLAGNAGLAAFNATAPALGLTAARNALIQNGNLCAAITDRNYVSPFNGGNAGCFSTPYNYDRSRSTSEGYSGEIHLNTKFDGPVNFLLGGIYLHGVTDGDYYVVNSEGGLASAVIGYAQGLAIPGVAAGSVYKGPAYYNSETDRYVLKSYGIFGETYIQFSDKLKLTGGLRYSHDDKFVRDRNPLVNVLIPYTATNAFTSQVGATVPGIGFDADASTAGFQTFREANVSFGRLTGRAVLDYKPSDNSLIFLSYSRGYKSGGINPPFDPTVFSAPATFRPESVDAIELGSKNTFMNGMLRLNGSAFYYRYKDLQLSRILNKTSFNDNTDADIYGAEVEATIRPDHHFLVNLSASYLKTKIKDFSIVDTRDPSAGRTDTVIVKDIQFANNCVVQSTTGSAVAANTLVNAVNGSLGLVGTRAIPGTNTTGAISLCSALAGAIAAPSAPLRALFATPTGALPFAFNVNASGTGVSLPDGIPVNLRGNQLPNAPEYKFSAGVQHTLGIGRFNLVSRADLNYTGDYFARSFNRPIDRIQGYEVVNVSLQLNAPDDRFFLRGFVQNLTDNNAITGQYVTDASTGLFTNVFTLEPRRYGVAAGFKF